VKPFGLNSIRTQTECSVQWRFSVFVCGRWGPIAHRYR